MPTEESAPAAGKAVNRRGHGVVGIAGLGRMGGAFAAQLLSHRYEVVAVTRRHKDEGFAAAGGRYCEQEELPLRTDLILSFLPTEEALRTGADAWKHHLTDTHVVVDCSNLPAQSKREALRLLPPTAVLDCPVHGTPEWVRQRKALILASGPPQALHLALPVLEAVTDRVYVVGDFGTGSAMKAAVNALRFIEVTAAAEAMRLAEVAGVSPEVAAAVLVASFGGSPEVARRSARMVAGDYLPPTGSISGVSAEMAELTRLARQYGLRTPTLEAARDLITAADAAGLGDSDASAVLELLRRSAPRDHEHPPGG